MLLDFANLPHPSTLFSYSLDGVKYTPSTKWERINAQRRVLSDSKSIQLCGIAGRYCKSPRCGHCSRYLYRTYLSDVLDAHALADPQSAELLTLSFANVAAGNLAMGYDQLTSLYRESFTKSSWLSDRCDGFLKATEITATPGTISTWNLHIHILLSHDSENIINGQKIIERWNGKAAVLGIPASAVAQHSQVIPVADIPKTAAYVLKQHLQHLNKNSESFSPGDLLNAAAQGDAKAAELFHEFETASKGHRARLSGGKLKASTPKA